MVDIERTIKKVIKIITIIVIILIAYSVLSTTLNPEECLEYATFCQESYTTYSSYPPAAVTHYRYVDCTGNTYDREVERCIKW